MRPGRRIKIRRFGPDFLVWMAEELGRPGGVPSLLAPVVRLEGRAHFILVGHTVS
ncbi:MAG: hypothetical protein AB1679_26035 [Actinomycetota bacterium]